MLVTKELETNGSILDIYIAISLSYVKRCSNGKEIADVHMHACLHFK